MFKKVCCIALLFFLSAWTNTAGEKKRLEIVFCLDLSGSTNGLLQDVRDNMWHIVNYVLQSHPETELRLGAIGFSRQSFGPENDFVTILCDLTTHYDYLSNQLFSLPATVEKGDQLVGSALHASINEMSWSADTSVNKIVFMFGNGRVDLGRYDYRRATDIAVEKKIVVNPVYCLAKKPSQKDMLEWYSIAKRTGGEMNTFKVTMRSPLKKTSTDAEWVTEANNDLNDTYIYFNRDGSARYDEMINADINSLSMNEQFFYARCNYKISSHYQSQCAEWDLVSYLKKYPNVTPEINARNLPDDAQRTTLKDLMEAAKLKLERRENIMAKMKIKFLELGVDSMAVNPIDSVIISPLHKYF